MAAYKEITKSELLEEINVRDEYGVFSPYYSQYGVSEELISFINDDHIVVYGAFLANEKYYVVFGKTLRPDELIDDKKTNSVFSNIKTYGSSKQYRGVVDGCGQIIIPTQYLDVRPLMNDILMVKSKLGKYGIIKLSGSILAKPDYDGFGPVSESVFAAYKDGKVGFLNLKGEVEIPFEYERNENDVSFSAGLACMLKEIEPGKTLFGYINHKNEVVIPFRFSFHEDFNGKDSIKNVEYVTPFPGDYRKDEYLLSLDGSMILLESEYVEGRTTSFDV